MKDIKEEKKCKVAGACRSHCSSVVGGILIILATLLTLWTLNGLGILGMFLVGMFFCRRKFGCGCSCHGVCGSEACHAVCGCSCHDSHETSCRAESEAAVTMTKSATKKAAKKDSE